LPPAVLLIINAADNSIAKTYIHANGQVLMRHDGDYNAAKYFYSHDRLGPDYITRDELSLRGYDLPCYPKNRRKSNPLVDNILHLLKKRAKSVHFCAEPARFCSKMLKTSAFLLIFVLSPFRR
jgi:hypothetical protein